MIRDVIVGCVVLVIGMILGYIVCMCIYSNDPLSRSKPLPACKYMIGPSHTITVEMKSDSPKMMLLHNFLTPDECDDLIALGEKHKFKRSTVQGSSTDEVSKERTSHTYNFERKQTKLINDIEQRATLFCPFSTKNVENLQIVRYNPGQQYKHHYDYFVPGREGTDVALKRGGQRHVTFFVYLNDMSPGETGGQTDFPNLNMKIAPRKGTAVMWYNVENGKEDDRTYHAGLPPVMSTKYGLNIWVREREFV
jgi:prolyl 4-hydroxylase